MINMIMITMIVPVAAVVVVRGWGGRRKGNKITDYVTFVMFYDTIFG